MRLRLYEEAVLKRERQRFCYGCDDFFDRDNVRAAVPDDLVCGVLSAVEKADGLFPGGYQRKSDLFVVLKG